MADCTCYDLDKFAPIGSVHPDCKYPHNAPPERITALHNRGGRPSWMRAAFTRTNAENPLYSPLSEFTSEDGTKHVIEYTRAGTRGKDRFLVLFEKPK